MTLKLANFSTALLAAPIDSSDTTLTITSGSEVNFPTLAAGDWFPVVVVDNLANREVMRCTARTTNVLTVTRGQENTAAMAFSAGARVDARFTTAALNELLQKTVPIASGERLDLSGDSTKGRIRFTGTGKVGLEFSKADLFFGAADTPTKRFVWNDKVDGTGTDVATMSETGQLALGSMAIPTGGRSNLYAPGEITINNTLGYNAHWDTVSARWEHVKAGWAAHLGLDLTSGQVTLMRANATRAAAAAFDPATALVYWTNNNFARFPSRIYASDAFLNTDGNIFGSVWQSFSISNNTDAYTAIANRIEERCSAYRDSVITNTRMAGAIDYSHHVNGSLIEYSGYVITGSRKVQNDPAEYLFRYRQPQKYIANVGWSAAFAF